MPARRAIRRCLPAGFSNKPDRRKAHARRTLRLEQLEERSLLAVGATPGAALFSSLAVDPSSYSPTHLLVRYRDGAQPAGAAPVVGTEFGAALPLVPGLREVRLTADIGIEDVAAAYLADPAVEYVEPDYRLHITTVPNDPSFGSLWGLNNTGQSGGTADADIDAPEAWAVTTGSRNTIVAVIDTGVDYNHPDLAANIWTNPGEIAGDGIDNDGNGFVDDVHGYDFFNNDGNPMDDQGHGTHVAGTIGAAGNNGVGVTGINWNVQIMALKFLDSSGSGSTSDAIRALDYAVRMGADLSNNSYGGDPFSQSFYDALVRARTAGHIFVAAAGNDGANNDATPFYPANYQLDNVVSVAATDANDELAYFSNYGATTVDLAAPGVDIYSTKPNGTYGTSSGTSMAAPHATGVLALVHSQHPDWSAQQVIGQVLDSVDVLPSLAGRVSTGGRLNAARAVGAPDTQGPRVIATSPSGTISGSLSAMRVTFNEPIALDTFTLDDIAGFTGPNGPIVASAVTPVAGTLGRQFDIAFPTQSAKGGYQLTIGPNIADVAGNLMDQDADGTGGEAFDDRYAAAFTLGDAFVFTSNDVPARFGLLGSAASSLAVDRELIIDDVNVQLSLNHPSVGDLRLYLESPLGTRVTLSQLNGGVAADFRQTVFDDEAATPIGAGAAPFTGAFRPDTPLSDLDGQNALGTWQLLVENWGIYGGSLTDWSLTMYARLPRIFVSDVRVPEGDSGVKDAVVTLALEAAAAEPVSVDYATADATAVAGVDYQAAHGTVVFQPGEKVKTVALSVLGDTLDEPDETFLLSLSNAQGAVLPAQAAVVTIQNDEASLTIGDASLVEGNSGTASAVFTVTRSGLLSQAATVSYSTADDTATAGSDYTAQSGTVSFVPGEASKTVSVPVLGDTRNEPDERFLVRLTSPVNAVLAGAAGAGTILNDDPLPAFTVGDVSATEGDSGTKNVLFFVSLSAASGQTVSVEYATVNGTAQAGSDFTGQSGVLVFTPGQTVKTVSVALLGDTAAEPDETFRFVLSHPVGALMLDGEGVATVRNDDTSLRIDDAGVVVEGDLGAAMARFPVTLSAAVPFEASVRYATAAGTASSGVDFLAQSGTLRFAPGQTVQWISVPVVGDALDEADESFTVSLSSPTGAQLADSQATATIADDDATPSVSIADAALTEGDSGTKNLAFTLTLSAPSGRTVSVIYATTDGTASAGSDYTAKAGTLTFYAGSTSQTIYVPLVGDATPEPDETFALSLSNPVGATLDRASAAGTILDDDTLHIADASVSEGDNGAALAVFSVTLAEPRPYPISVDYATANSTAVAGSDYVARSGSLLFAPGETQKNISVPVAGDTISEAAKAFFVNLSNSQGTALGDTQAVGTIVDDDPLPSIAVSDVAVAEGNSGTKTVTFSLSLSAAAGRILSVQYATADGTAAAGSDYVAKAGTVTFYAGSTSQTVAVTVNGDAAVEPDETFTLNLSNPTYAVLGNTQATAVIANDDPYPLFAVNDVKTTEGNAGTKSLGFTVSLSSASTQTVTASYATVDGTARAGADYVAQSGVITFTPGQTSKFLYVSLVGDTAAELDETFSLVLSNPVNAGMLDSTGSGTIQNDDSSLRIDDVSVQEGGAGLNTALVTVTLASPPPGNVTVAFATANSTATAGVDYVAQSGTLTFAPGQTQQTIAVPIVGDTLNEANEALLVNLSAASNATIADSQGVATIVDDDPALPRLSVANASISEGDSGTKNLSFAVSLSNASGRTVTVQYATAAGTATSGVDYTAKSGTLTFYAGTSSQLVSVPLVGDTAAEIDETFRLVLSGAAYAAIDDGEAVGTILDDDLLAIGNVTLVETDAGLLEAAFPVTLAVAAPYPISARFATANGTALSGSDYAAQSGSIVFAPGQTQQIIRVPVAGDLLSEADETFYVNLTNVVGTIADDAQGAALIADNDPMPAIAVGDVVVLEGNAGTKSAVFTVTLSAPAGRNVTVDYATADGTATAGGDYLAKAGSLTFLPGIVSQTVAVTVQGDALVEADETFQLALSNAAGATLSVATAQATILDDDGQAPQATSLDVADGSRQTVTIASASEGAALRAGFAANLSARSASEDASPVAPARKAQDAADADTFSVRRPAVDAQRIGALDAPRAAAVDAVLTTGWGRTPRAARGGSAADETNLLHEDSVVAGLPTEPQTPTAGLPSAADAPPRRRELV